MSETLKRSEILRHKRQFDRIRNCGRRISGPLLYLRCAPSSTPAHPDPLLAIPDTACASSRRAGFLLARNTKGAVRRNRLKRRLREIFRRHKHWFPAGCDYLFYAAPETADLSSDQLLKLAKRLAEKVKSGS